MITNPVNNRLAKLPFMRLQLLTLPSSFDNLSIPDNIKEKKGRPIEIHIGLQTEELLILPNPNLTYVMKHHVQR